MAGGNMNDVRREGDTVVRTGGPWTATVHRYLDYLALAGVTRAPLPLAVEGEFERLTFVHGDVPLYPLPGWVWEESTIVDGAVLLRQLHDASIGFPVDGSVWQSPTKVPSEVICHNDFAPHNLAFERGRIVGVIDFDMCSPGPRLWDIAYFATRAVPLTAVTPPGAPGMDQARRRTQVILDAYGSDATLADVLRVAIIRLHDLAGMSRRLAVTLRKPNLADEADEYERDAAYLRTLAWHPDASG
jgi:hypothetical protein